MEYRRELALDTEARYTWVRMGTLDRLNGPAAYPFPTDKAAELFARTNRDRDPHREIRVDYHDGREWEL